MSASENSDQNPILFVLLPVLPSAFFGLILVWQQGASSTSLSFAFLMVLFSFVASYFIWVWHTDHLERLEKHHQQKFKEGLHRLTAYATELEHLLLAVEPKLAEYIQTAKDMVEHDTNQLARRLAIVNEALKKATEPSAAATEGGDDKKGTDSLAKPKTDLAAVANELGAILETLQFQSRANPILMLVKANLAAIRGKLEQIQTQGNNRHKRMLNVDELMILFQTQYETAKRDSRNPAKRAEDGSASH